MLAREWKMNKKQNKENWKARKPETSMIIQVCMQQHYAIALLPIDADVASSPILWFVAPL